MKLLLFYKLIKSNFREVKPEIKPVNPMEPYAANGAKRKRRGGEFFNKRLYGEKSHVNYKVIVIGDPTIGKNALLSRFAHRKLENREFSSIGVALFEKQVHLEQKNVIANLMLWVIGAVPHFYMLHRAFFNGANGIVLVFDIARSSTFYNINNWHNITIHYGLRGIPKILIGNRINLKDKRKIPWSSAESLCKKLDAPYFETSTLNGENINLIFHKIAELIYRAKERKDDEDRYPYPYIFKPPGPPGDLGVETQAHIKKSMVKKPENRIYCQYCGKELTEDEQFSHNCRKRP